MDDDWYEGWKQLWEDNEPFDDDEEFDVVFVEEPMEEESE
jgi:hypothetical protein